MTNNTALALAGSIALLVNLLGCATRDRNSYYIDEKSSNIWFYDEDARKWTMLTGKTAKFFISEDTPSLGNGPERGEPFTSYHHRLPVISPARVAKARFARDARPAAEDPEGNWGQACQGFQMGLRFEETSFEAGERILATLVMRNVSHGDRLCFWSTDQLQHLEATVIDSQNRSIPRKDLLQTDNTQKPRTFQERLQTLAQRQRGFILDSGFQRKEIRDLIEMFDLRPGSYTVSAKRSFCSRQGTNYIHSATAAFRILEQDRSE
jgi:hypothetical protein